MNTDEKKELRNYLLKGIQPGEKADEIEEILMVNEKYFDALLLEEEELIQDYADNNLTTAEREDFEKNFLITSERHKKVKFALALRKYLDRQKVLIANETETKEKRNLRSFFKLFLKPLPVATTVIIICLASALVWNFYVRETENSAVIAALNRAYRIERPLESRITSFGYAPFGQTRGETDTKIDTRERNRAEITAQEAAANDPNAANLHMLARIYLTKRKFDEALTEIENALRLAPQNAEINSDAGVIYLEKSKAAPDESGEKLELAAKALDYFDRALRINPDLPAARFNKAIALEALGSFTEAGKAWRNYLNSDADSDWATEARQRLKALDSRQSQNKTSDEILRDFLAAYRANDDENAYRVINRNREMITGKLIPQQLAFLYLKADGAEKQNYLAALEYAGNLEKQKSADPFFFEITKFYATLPAEKQTKLIEAHGFLQKGYDCLQNNCKNALDDFTRARAIFIEAGDDREARFTDYWIGYCIFGQNKIKESINILDELAEFCQARNYKWLAAQAFSWQANNIGSLKEYSKAIEYNQKALRLAEETSDAYLNQKSLSQLSDLYRRTANYGQAINFASQTLAAANLPEASRRQKGRDFAALANLFFAMQYYAAALAFHQETLDLSNQLNDNSYIFSSFVNSGRILGAQEKFTEALGFFEKARLVAENFGEETGGKARASLNLQKAHVLRQAENCQAALDDYDKAISFYENGEFQLNLYDARKGRLLCYYANKDDSAFQNELPMILKLFGDYRSKILEEQNRNSFFDREQSVYDIAIGYEFDKQNYRKAFDYSEESRARSLLDLQNAPIEVFRDSAGKPDIKFAASVTEPLRLTEIQAKMPADVQLLQYSMLSDKTLIWLITKDNLSVVQTSVAAPDLQKEVSTYLELIKKNDALDTEKISASAKKIYRILVSPIENRLDAEKQLCLIADKILFRLPFAALISPDDEKYFVSRYKFFLSPSANVFLVNSEKAEKLRHNTADTILSVGNPSFSRKDFAALPNLDSSAREAEEIAALYENKHRILLTGKNASKENFKSNLSNADVIHFAGHYLPNENSPLLSKLILAENERTHDVKDSTLANYEIIGAKLSRTKLIVLSACQTGVENFYSGEGITGAARTFLATGVPLVVASQWNVDSEATAELMIRFHYYQAVEKLPTVEALRRAQLDLATGENKRFQNPYYWAAFTVFGGYANF